MSLSCCHEVSFFLSCSLKLFSYCIRFSIKDPVVSQSVDFVPGLLC